jgi:excisionase family DNA binding protein
VTLDALALQLADLTAEVRALAKRLPAQLVDSTQAAAALGVSLRTFRRAVAADRIPYRMVGRSRRFDLAALKPRA